MLKPFNNEQIKLMERAGKIVADTITLLGKSIRPGITTNELNALADDYIRSQDAYPTFLNYNNFPKSVCISVEDCVVHGIPSDRILNEGEIVSIDCGATYKGFVGDSAATFPVGEISDEKKRLLKVTEEALWLGIEQAQPGKKVYALAAAIQKHCESNGYSLTRELTGHGVGKYLHMKPSIPNFIPPLLQRKSLPNDKIINGIGLAIEPMVHIGGKEVYVETNNWEIITRDHSPAAHFEHTIIVQGNTPIITTLRN